MRIDRFKLLMIVGKYTLALEELISDQYFIIPVTHFAIILNQIGILKTRHNFWNTLIAVNFVPQENDHLQMTSLQQHLSDSFDY